jgi:hypothetical protein
MKAPRGSVTPRREQAREMRRKGASIREIMAALDIKGVATAHKFVKDIPNPAGGPWRAGRRRNAKRWQRIRALRMAGWSYHAIADSVQCSTSLVHKVLVVNGVQL